MVTNGIVTMRQYEKTEFFADQFYYHNRKVANASFTNYSIQRWLSLRLDTVALTFSSFAACLVTLIEYENVTADQLAFCLQITTDVIVFFSVCIRMISWLEEFMVSSQHIVAYSKLDTED